MAYGDLQSAMTSRMGGKKKRPPPAAAEDAGDGGTDDGVTVEGEEPDNEGAVDMSSYEDVEDSAASDMFDAVKSDDREAFKTALSDYVAACVQRQMKAGK